MRARSILGHGKTPKVRGWIRVQSFAGPKDFSAERFLAWHPVTHPFSHHVHEYCGLVLTKKSIRMLLPVQMRFWKCNSTEVFEQPDVFLSRKNRHSAVEPAFVAHWGAPHWNSE